MNDYSILENLFKNEQDEIHFELFKESNVIKINNNNGDNNNFDNGISFNTQSISSKMINYKDAYVLLHIECEIPFDETDQGKKSIPKLLYLKNSFEIVKKLKVQLNNVTILNEGNVNRSSLIDFVLDNPQTESIMYRNIKKASSTGLNITDNKFITKDTYFTKQEDSDEEKNHFIDFEIPIFLKDISSFFKNIDIIHYGEFNILIDLIDEIFVSSRDGVTYDIKSAYLIVEEIKLSEEDEISYRKKLDNGYIKKINFLENNVKIVNDKFNIPDFYLNNVRNGDSIFIYGILDANKTGLNYDLPSVKLNEPYLLIDNVRFENSIPNDISAYKSLKSKSMYSNNFIINYDDYINYYRIYYWNISREIKDDNANKFINILTGMETASREVYIVFKTSASITLKYSKNDKLIVYKSQ